MNSQVSHGDKLSERLAKQKAQLGESEDNDLDFDEYVQEVCYHSLLFRACMNIWIFKFIDIQKLQALQDDFLSEVVRRKLHLDDDTLRQMLAELRRQQCDVIALQVREFEAMKRRLEERLAAEVRKLQQF